MLFTVSSRWSPLIGLGMLILGGLGIKLGIPEGHEIIGAGLAMLTLSRREDDSPPPPRSPLPPAVVVAP